MINMIEIKNKKAYFDYTVLDSIEAGISLVGTEIKSIENGGTDARVNINTADKEELMTLAGIGESKAEAIIAYREENGGFSSPEDIKNISGIKDGVYSKIKDSICVN